jgi:tetratricopeptide (TPR) repeat protein
VIRSKVIDVDHLIATADALYVSAERPERAVRIVDRALKMAPDHADALLLKGQILTALGRVPLAIRCFNRAIAVRPRFADAYLERARVLYAVRENFRDALTDVGCALRFARRDPKLRSEAHRLRGHILDALERSTEAAAAYRAAIRLNPRDAQAHEALGDVLLARGEPERAIRQFDKALGLLKTRLPEDEQQIGLVVISKADALNAAGRELDALRMLRDRLQRTRDLITREILKAAVERVLRTRRGRARPSR